MTRQPIRRALSIELASEPTSRSAGSAGGALRSIIVLPTIMRMSRACAAAKTASAEAG